MRILLSFIFLVFGFGINAANYQHRRCPERIAIARACLWHFSFQETSFPWLDDSGNSMISYNGNDNPDAALRINNSYTTNGFILNGLGYSNTGNYTTNDTVNPSQCTRTIWVNFNAKTGFSPYYQQNIESRYNSLTGFTGSQNFAEFILFYANSGDRINFYIFQAINYSPGSTIVAANTFGSPPIGVWLLVTTFIDSANGVFGISVNGGAFDTGAIPWAVGATDTIDTTFGYLEAVVSMQPFTGQLDEPAKFNKILTNREISLIFNCHQGRKYPFN